jgi:hypothetical protein
LGTDEYGGGEFDLCTEIDTHRYFDDRTMRRCMMSRNNFLWALATVLAFFAGALIPSGGTQSAAAMQTAVQPKSPKYLEINYMKVEPAKNDDYVRMEKDIWKPLHQHRIKNGQLRSWAMYGMKFPFGTDEKYDYVTFNAYDQFTQLEDPYGNAAQLLIKLHPNMKPEDLARQTNSARKLVRSEVWELVDEAQ